MLGAGCICSEVAQALRVPAPWAQMFIREPKGGGPGVEKKFESLIVAFARVGLAASVNGAAAAGEAFLLDPRCNAYD